MSDAEFSHLDPLGRARMVDVTPKEPTHRRAVARCKVFMQASNVKGWPYDDVEQNWYAKDMYKVAE